MKDVAETDLTQHAGNEVAHEVVVVDDQNFHFRDVKHRSWASLLDRL
jgi:hypothetical protein